MREDEFKSLDEESSYTRESNWQRTNLLPRQALEQFRVRSNSRPQVKIKSAKDEESSIAFRKNLKFS